MEPPSVAAEHMWLSDATIVALKSHFARGALEPPKTTATRPLPKIVEARNDFARYRQVKICAADAT